MGGDPTAPPTIYDWGGGRPAFERWLTVFYGLVEQDELPARYVGLGVTPEQRLHFVTLLSRAPDAADLPADPEFRAAIIGYAEWGSRLAVHNSQPGAEVAQHAPVPVGAGASRRPYQP